MTWIFGRGLFLLMMVLCGPGEAVKCYLCSTKENETQCLYPNSYNLPLAKCDLEALENTRRYAKRIDPIYDKIFEVATSDMSNVDLNCLKVETKLGNKLYTFRGCQLAEQNSLDICFKMKKADTEYLIKQHCSRCSIDGCNSAPKLSKQEVNYFLIVVMSTFIYSSFQN